MARDMFSSNRRTYLDLYVLLTLIYQKLCSPGTSASLKSKMFEGGWMRYNMFVYQNLYFPRNLLGHNSISHHMLVKWTGRSKIRTCHSEIVSTNFMQGMIGHRGRI